MPRTDIWRDGINTQFSRENQPANRGRKKEQPVRATIYRRLLALINGAKEVVEQQRRAEQEMEQQQRDHRNAQRRERYRIEKSKEKGMEKRSSRWRVHRERYYYIDRSNLKYPAKNRWHLFSKNCLGRHTFANSS